MHLNVQTTRNAPGMSSKCTCSSLPRPSQTAVQPQKRQVVAAASKPSPVQNQALCFAAALLMAPAAGAFELPELPNPFAKSETEQTRDEVAQETAGLPKLTESGNPTDFNQQKGVPGLQAKSSLKDNGAPSNTAPSETSQGLGDIEARKKGVNGKATSEVYSAGGVTPEQTPTGDY